MANSTNTKPKKRAIVYANTTHWPNDNFVLLAAQQINCSQQVQAWQLHIGFQLLYATILHRHRIGLCNKQYLSEYRHAQHLLTHRALGAQRRKRAQRTKPQCTTLNPAA